MSAAPNDPRAAARGVLAKNSKSFALASRLLPPEVASDVFVLYAYCRRADDAVDLATPEEQPGRLAALHAELDVVYGVAAPNDPDLATFQAVVRSCRIPRAYLEELLEGMRMDVEGTAYHDFSDLALYAHRVAGVVGLMMCHVMGVRRQASLEHAAHLGIGMQLTNIARDVLEDWQRSRLYLPDDLLAEQGLPDLRARLGQPFPPEAAGGVARVTAALLDRAEAYYASGDAGVADLSLRCGLAVRAARSIYAAIGDRVRAQGCNPLAGRAVVSGRHKLALAALAAGRTVRSAPGALFSPAPVVPGDVFPMTNLVL